MSPNINFDFTCEGWIKLRAVVLDDAGEVVSSRDLTDWFPNLILDQGLDRMGTGLFKSNCQVGTGTTPPATTDTGLASYLAGANILSANETSNYTAGPPPYMADITCYRFTTGTAAGILTEIGFGWATSGLTLYSRALIVDGSGNPTSITVLPTETLDAYYQHRIYPPTADVTGVINISGVDYNYTIRASRISTTNFNTAFNTGWGASGSGAPANFFPYNVNATIQSSVFNGALGTITGSPSGTAASGVGSVALAAYVPGSYARSGTLTMPIGNGNISGGFSAMTVATTWAFFQVGFSPNIPKTNSFQFQVTYTLTWNRRSI